MAWSTLRAVCPENDALVEYMRNWWREIAENKPKGYSLNKEMTIKKALSNVCLHKSPITTVDDFMNIRGVGQWFVRNLRDFFICDSGASGDGVIPKEGKKVTRGTGSYLPKKNSVAYALLVTLYRHMENGAQFLYKQELIDAAEASGLASVPIAPEKGKGKPGKPGNSPKEWYSGWSSMGKLINKGLVLRSGRPAKYMLSDAGREKAFECLLRSNLIDSVRDCGNKRKLSDSEKLDGHNSDVLSIDSTEEVTLSSVDWITKKCMIGVVPLDYLDHVSADSATGLTLTSARLSTKKSIKDDVPAEFFERAAVRSDSANASSSDGSLDGQKKFCTWVRTSCRSCASFETHVASLRTCSSSDHPLKKAGHSGFQPSQNALRNPPLGYLEKFEDVYDVILILDDREQFVRSKSKNLIRDVCSKFGIEIQVRRLPVGDGVWVARHKQDCTEYVLDVIVERKNVDDLRSSIRDNRYRDQKLRLLRTGLKKMIYVVEGDSIVCEAADSIKTACFTTEILEGFDVQRTKGLGDTLQLYGYLTLAITDYYRLSSHEDSYGSTSSCLQYSEFIKNNEDFDKLTVSEVFSLQLMQIPRVTEEAALSVLDCYPTLHSLTCAYLLLDGDTRAQEELLMKKSNNKIGAAASRNIFRMIWK